MSSKTFAGFILVVAIAASAFTSTASAQDKASKKAELKGQKGRGASEKDENIKVDKNDKSVIGNDAKVEAPASKGGAKTRGEAAAVVIDNRTQLYIDIYLDGNYKGTIAPYGDAYTYVLAGSTKFYARALVGGNYVTWGPAFDTVSGTYTWTLTY